MTKEEAKTALGDRNDLLWGMSKEKQKYYSEALDMAISALKGGWIPIEENEPEESMDVYITVELPNRPPFAEKATFFKAQRKYLTNRITVASSLVTAWQPLPEPYKKGE